MRTANATTAKNQFGQILEAALSEPVVITKTGRRVAVMLNWKEYERLSALEDAWWAEQAAKAEKQGYLGPKASADFLRRKLNAKA
jgi:prevent-host-death family protein